MWPGSFGACASLNPFLWIMVESVVQFHIQSRIQLIHVGSVLHLLSTAPSSRVFIHLQRQGKRTGARCINQGYGSAKSNTKSSTKTLPGSVAAQLQLRLAGSSRPTKDLKTLSSKSQIPLKHCPYSIPWLAFRLAKHIMLILNIKIKATVIFFPLEMQADVAITFGRYK